MSAKKPAANKDKSSHATEAKTKLKPPARGCSSGNKESSKETCVMDGRSGKDRRHNDRRENNAPVAVDHRASERRVKVSRRRQIDPTTCERDYSPEEVEFMSALDVYKRRSGRMFPTCSEVLEVIKGLGYEKRGEATATPLPTEPLTVVAATTEQAV